MKEDSGGGMTTREENNAQLVAEGEARQTIAIKQSEYDTHLFDIQLLLDRLEWALGVIDDHTDGYLDTDEQQHLAHQAITELREKYPKGGG